MKQYCFVCKWMQGYYRYKTATRGRPRLVSFYCEFFNPDVRRRIVNARYGVAEKMKTSPRWCPLKMKKRKGLKCQK